MILCLFFGSPQQTDSHPCTRSGWFRLGFRLDFLWFVLTCYGICLDMLGFVMAFVWICWDSFVLFWICWDSFGIDESIFLLCLCYFSEICWKDVICRFEKLRFPNLEFLEILKISKFESLKSWNLGNLESWHPWSSAIWIFWNFETSKKWFLELLKLLRRSHT